MSQPASQPQVDPVVSAPAASQPPKVNLPVEKQAIEEKKGGSEKYQKIRRQRGGYRLEERKEFEVNRRHQEDFSHRAVLSKEIGMALLGGRRFKRVEVTCTLNLFFTTVKICSLFHRKIAGVAMIITLEKVHYRNFNDAQDQKGEEQEHSLFRITLTRFATENDKACAGFNASFKAEDIKDPYQLADRLLRTKRREPQRRDYRDNRGEEKGNRREYDNRDNKRSKYEDNRSIRRERDRAQTKPRPERQQRERRDRNEYDNRQTNERQHNDRPRRQERDDYECRRNERTRTPQRPQRRYIQTSNRNTYKQEQPKKEYQPKQGHKEQKNERQYERGQPKSRGTSGNVAPHRYEPGHLKEQEEKRAEERGQRGPKRNRYSEDED